MDTIQGQFAGSQEQKQATNNIAKRTMGDNIDEK